MHSQPKVLIVAEAGSVHDGSFGNACKLIEAAAVAGADVVKFQMHIAEAETLADAPMPPYFEGEPRYEYFRRTSFTAGQWKRLRDQCVQHGVRFLSSPFSLEAVDLLEEIGVDAYKVPSGEVTNIPLLEKLATTRKPVLLSSGMSNWEELDVAVGVLKQGGPLTIMQCSSIYPCPPESVGLNVIQEMRDRYRLPVGFSDHTQGPAAAVAAAALGAVAIEKHFAFSRLMYGSDAKFATEPEEFAAFCRLVREAWQMREHPVDKNDVVPYAEMKRVFEKSIVTAKPIKAGTVLSREDLAFKKPGDGIGARFYKNLIGKRVARDLPANHKLLKEDFS